MQKMTYRVTALAAFGFAGLAFAGGTFGQQSEQFCGNQRCGHQQRQSVQFRQKMEMQQKPSQGPEQQTALENRGPDSVFMDTALDNSDAVGALSKLHQINQEEIVMGSLALSNSQNPGVRSFALRLIQDHRLNDHQLRSVARSQSFTLQPLNPSNPQDKSELDRQRQQMQHLTRLNGAQFDQAFLKQMVDGHQKALDFLQAQRNLKNASARNLVNATIPVVQSHLQQAQSLLSQLNRR